MLKVMYQIVLKASEKLDLEYEHRKSRDALKSDRIKAILLRSEGRQVSEIAHVLRVHVSTITRHIKDYINDKKLRYSKDGSKSYLSERQTEELIMHLSDKLYHHTHEIVSYVQARWNISYSIAGMTKWLHKNGFSYKKPKGRPHKADIAQQEAFVEMYEDLKTSLKLDEQILFMDSVHPTQASKISYGWIPTGKTHDIPTTASRTRVNIIGAMSLDHIENTTVATYGTINSQAIEDFFEKLREKYPLHMKLHIILDQAGYHRSENVKKKAQLCNIELHYLPPYSPNLNSIERLWKVMNEYARNNRFFKSAKDFKESIRNFFQNTLPEIGTSLSGRINDNFQKLNPPY